MTDISVVVVLPAPFTVVPAGYGLQGVPGPAGAAGGGSYTHSQPLAALVWTVAHNLGRYPSVTAADNLGNVVTPDVAYIDMNIVRVTHGSALTGFVYCN